MRYILKLLSMPLVCLVLSGTGRCDRQTPLNVALNLPLSGPLATYGVSVREGVEFALLRRTDLNLSNSAIHWNWQDNRSDGRTTAQVAAYQMTQSPDVYVSGVRPQIKAIAQRIEATAVPHFAWVFDTNVRKIAQHTYRTWVSFGGEAELFVETIVKRAPKRVAILYVQLPNTDEQYQELILPRLREKIAPELSVQAYSSDKTDFRDLALRIREFKPDLIVINGFQENLVAIVRALRQLNLIKAGNTIASFDMFDAAPLLAKQDVEGIELSTPQFLFEEKAKKWKEEFSARFGRVPLYSHYYAFDMATFLFEVSSRTKDGASFGEIEEVIKTTAIDGITGRIAFDKNGDIQHRYVLGKFQDGVLVAAQ